LLSLKSLEAINGNVSTLIGRDFLTALLSEPTSKWNENPIQDAFPEIPNFIKETFRIRNIVCHEFAIKERVGVRKARKLLTNCSLFILFVEEFVQRHLLTPNAQDQIDILWPQDKLEGNI
jgi:hypothetical protein